MNTSEITLPEAAPSFERAVYLPGGKYIEHTAPQQLDLMGGMNFLQLAYLHRNPDHPMNQIVEGPCSQGCETTISGKRLFVEGGRIACDRCIEKAKELELNKLAQKFWERVCPKQLRATDTTHPGFPRQIYANNRSYAGTTSLFLYGPSGSGKTRCGGLLLKRALLKGKSVQFLWPEELKTYAKSNDRLKFIHELGSHQVLLLDDALLTGAHDERIADFLKDLIDFMQRHENHMIITSQIGGDDYEQQADKFGNITKADRERIDALLRRIRENFTVIPFAGTTTTTAKDETMF